MKKKGIIIGGILLVLIGLVAVFSSNSGPQEAGPVKIGLALPLSGNLAFLGEPEQRAAQLALKDAGETKYQYELVFEDDQFDPKQSATAASKLINIDNVLAIISFGSATGNTINPIAENGRTVQFAIASDPTVANGEYNYIHWTPPFEEGKLLAQEIVRRGYKTVSIIDTNHPGTLAVTNAIKEQFAKTDVQIVSYDLINIGETDFRTIINKIKQADPEIIVLEMSSPEIELAARQIKELGLNKPVTSIEAFEWSSSPELFEGSWFVSDSVVPEFAEMFKAAYGTDPMTGSSYVYDLVLLLIELQENERNPIKPADLPNLITKLGTWNSPIFNEVPINNEGFFITNASIKVIKDGKAVLAEN